MKAAAGITGCRFLRDNQNEEAGGTQGAAGFCHPERSSVRRGAWKTGAIARGKRGVNSRAAVNGTARRMERACRVPLSAEAGSIR